MQIGTICMQLLLKTCIQANAVTWSLETIESTLHLHTTTCHNCLHFCVILFVPFANFKLWITLNCQGCLPLIDKWNSKHYVSKTCSLVVHHFPIFPTNIRPKCYPFHRDAYFPALLKRSSISNNVFIVWLWSLFTFCSCISTFNAWSHLWFIIFCFCFFYID